MYSEKCESSGASAEFRAHRVVGCGSNTSLSAARHRLCPALQPASADPPAACTLTLDRDAMDYFRAAKAVGEQSERVLALTKDIIDMTPGHYSVW